MLKRDNIISIKKVPNHGKRNHNNKDILTLQILHNSIIHEQPHLIPLLHQHSRQQIGQLLDIQIGMLAITDGDNMGKGRIIAHGLDVDEADENVGQGLLAEGVG